MESQNEELAENDDKRPIPKSSAFNQSRVISAPRPVSPMYAPSSSLSRKLALYYSTPISL